MEPSHSPLQGPMLVSHYKLLSISLAEMQNDRQSAQVVRAHETIMAWQAEIVAAGNPPSSFRKMSKGDHTVHHHASIGKLGMTHSGNRTHRTHTLPSREPQRLSLISPHRKRHQISFPKRLGPIKEGRFISPEKLQRANHRRKESAAPWGSLLPKDESQ